MTTITLPRGNAWLIGPSGRPRRRSPMRSELLAIFAGAALLYLAVGSYLAANDVAFADAYSRVANAMYVLYSRDPHLAAMGFVWNPLPSLSVLPLLPLHGVFPALLGYGLAGVIQSALCMAGAVALIDSCLAKLGVARRGWRLALTAVLAVQPIILLYAGSGQSEPMLLLTLAMTTSALLSWVGDHDPGQLVLAGLGLGLAYLTRYEGAATAIAVVALVGLVALATESGDWRWRVRVGANDVALVAGPFIFCFVLWAAAAWILVGEWFPTLSSRYGNAAQVSAMASWIDRSTGSDPWDRLDYVGRQILALAPALPLLLVIALVIAARARDLAPIIAPVVFGSVMAFTALVSTVGSSFAWIRFQITAVPLAVLVAGSIIAFVARTVVCVPRVAAHRRVDGRSSAIPNRVFGTWSRTATGIAVNSLVVVAVGMGIAAQARVLTDTSMNLAREEAPMMTALLNPAAASADDTSTLHLYDTERTVSAQIDAMNLPDGSVLGDSAYIYPMLLTTARPSQYVITSDRDFQAAVQDPLGHAIQFILVSSGGTSDAIQNDYPDLFANGAGIAKLADQWVGQRLGTWRLYRLN